MCGESRKCWMRSVTTVPVFVLAAVVAEAVCVLGKKDKVPERLV